MPKLMSEGICMCSNKAIVLSIFKQVASENGSLVLIHYFKARGLEISNI